MKRIELSLATISQLGDGAAAAQFARDLKTICADLLDRPHDKKAREVSLVVKATPADHTDESCEQVSVQIECVCKVPRHRTRTYSMNTHHNKALSFHPDLPDDPNGTSLFEGEDDSKRKENE